MPDIFDRHLISEKTLTTALLSRDSTVTELLLGYHGPASLDSRLLSAFLEVLKVFPVDRKSYDFAIAHLGHNDPEVRVKALKLLASTQDGLILYDNTPILSLLKDPIWFVRLHAVKVLGLRRCWPAAYDMVRLTSDENWQVRSAAAAALAGLGERALVLILDILKSSDQYAKEAVCRAVSTEVFVNLLRAKIEAGNPATVEMVREIIALMSSLNFELPLEGMIIRNDMHIKPEGVKKSLSEEA
jgi:HEAT repeat protein